MVKYLCFLSGRRSCPAPGAPEGGMAMWWPRDSSTLHRDESRRPQAGRQWYIRGVSVVTSTGALQWKGLQNDLLMDETMRVITLKWLMLNFKPAWPGEDSDLQWSWFVVIKHIRLFLIEIINRFLCTQWNFTHTCSGPYSLASWAIQIQF